MSKKTKESKDAPSKGVNTVANQPKPIGLFLCERILRDVLRPDAISCINIHNQMAVQAFPAIVPLVFAYSEVTGSTEEFTYQFKFLDKSGQTLAVSNVQKVAPLPSKTMTHKLIGAFQGLIFQEDGGYQLVLSLDGEDVGSMTFQVVHVPAEVTV
ncbi:MAG: hypothetical protein K2W95_14495 [Candidatus Obscuribacterales bacterium]|nr:hypothetical protein [Candidatus Obscuribacterales bacterium]